MKKIFLLGLSFIVLVMLLVAACSKATPAPTTAAPGVDTTTAGSAALTDDEMKALITERCGVSTCHSSSIVFNSSFSQSRWSTVFDQMIARGAQVSADEKTMMIDWLVANQ